MRFQCLWRSRPPGPAILLAGLWLLLAPIPARAQQSAAEPAQLTASPGNDLRAAWSPDGARVAFQSNRTGANQIWVINADGSGEQRVSRGEADDRHPGWSPDGRELIFDSGDEQVREIWTMDLDGRNRRQLTRIGAFSSFPAWSPDGKKVAFFSYQDEAMDLWLFSVDAAGARALTTRLADQQQNSCTVSCHAPVWAADSTAVAFASGEQRTVWILPLQTEELTRITSSRDSAHFPLLLPDGRFGYVQERVSAAGPATELWAIDLLGGQPAERLFERVRVPAPYQLSPDGRRLLFQSLRGGSFDLYLANLADLIGGEALPGGPAPSY